METALKECGNTPEGLTHSLDSTKEGLAMNATRCAVHGCDRTRDSRGYCKAHYQRVMSTGHPGPARIRRRIPGGATIAQRLEFVGWDVVDRVPALGACWEWRGRVNGGEGGGYGCFDVEQKFVLAHRAAYETWTGPIAPGEIVMHACDNRRCINPAHLEAGTQQRNLLDKFVRGRHTVTQRCERCRRFAGADHACPVPGYGREDER